MKNNLKTFGFEALYLLASVIVAGVSSIVQLMGREYESDYSSFIFSGHNYTYNYFFYIAGAVFFISFMISGYKTFLSKKMAGINWSGLAEILVFAIIALLFSVLMVAVILIFLIVISGYDNMCPEELFILTLFGWPVFCFVFMVCVEIVAIKRSVKEVKS